MSEAHRTSGATRLRLRLAATGLLPLLYDQLEWAEICVEAGVPQCARALYESLFIRYGFSPQLRRRWWEISARAELWTTFPKPPAVDTAPRGSIEIGLAELKALASALPALLRQAADPAVEEATPDAHQHAVRLRETIDDPTDLGAFAGALSGFLGRPPPQDWSDGDRLLARIVALADQTGPADRRALAAADLPTMAAMLTVLNLKEFVAANRHLCAPPTGSAELLWHAARFDSAGLGPYFDNVCRLVRKSRDVFELAQAGLNASEPSLAFGLFLLSDRLPRALLFELVDDLGDRGDMATLSLICRRSAERRISTDHDLITRIRDAALDNGDHDLAIRAQSFLADMSPWSADELEVLGAIYGTAGYTAAAEDAFVACLTRDPTRATVVVQLDALRKHEFSPFHLTGGYNTPEDRRLNRERRKRGAVSRKVCNASSPIAVELGSHRAVTASST